MTSREGWQIMAGRGMRSATSAIREPSGCPVSTNFDPLSETFLGDPYAVLAGCHWRLNRCSMRNQLATT
jgi:hypothetical protein